MVAACLKGRLGELQLFTASIRLAEGWTVFVLTIDGNVVRINLPMVSRIIIDIPPTPTLIYIYISR